jgi:hypothetical protein
MIPLLRSIALATTLIAVGNTHVAAAETEPLVQGNYFIEVYQRRSGALFYYGCMIVGNSGLAETPSLYDWQSGSGPCGTTSGLKQAQWDVYAITGRDASGQDRMVHVIKSRQNGKCLIRAGSGTANFASLYLWTGATSNAYCGLASPHELVQNGQASWNLSALTRGYNTSGFSTLTGPVSLLSAQTANLTFTPTPATAPSMVPDTSFATFNASTSDGWELRFRIWPITSQE